jgi:hypothetical protein
MLERVVQLIRRCLYHLLIIETELGYRRIELHFQPDALSLEGLRPMLRHFVQAIPQVVFTQLQPDFAAFECHLTFPFWKSANRRNLRG